MAETAVLQRVRVRVRSKRRKPPSNRKVFNRLWMANILWQLGRCMFLAFTKGLVNEIWYLLLALVISGLYIFWRRIDRQNDRAEARGHVRPVGRDEWGLLAMQWAVVLFITFY